MSEQETNTITLRRDEGPNDQWEMEAVPSEMSMTFRVWDIVIDSDGRPLYHDSGDCDFSEDKSKISPTMEGYIKWDGCCDFELGSGDSYRLHVCGRSSARKLVGLIDWVYDVAAEHIPKWSPELAR